MYNLQKVKEAFKNVITFDNITMSGYPVYIAPTSISGRTLSSFDSALIPENIYELFRESIPENTNFDISIFLEKFISQNTLAVISEVLLRKKIRFETKTLLRSTKLMHDKFARFERVTKQSRFVGLKFSCFEDLGVLIKLVRAGFGFSLEQTNFNLYIFNSNVIEPIQVITIPTINLDSKFVWQDIENIELSWFDDYASIGGYWYVGYYEDDLQGQAFTRSVNAKNSGCVECNNFEGIYYEQYKSYIDFEGFYVESGNYVIGESFDDSLAIKEDSNYGLNFHLQVECDLTEFLIMNKDLFVEAIGYKTAVRFYEEVSTQIRDNKISERLAGISMFKLLNSENKDYGLYSKLDRAIKGLDLETSNIYSSCLPCIDRSYNMINYGAI